MQICFKIITIILFVSYLNYNLIRLNYNLFMEKITRFPPEPNGFLHLGHCKSIFINWASDNKCHLRLDDTNPEAEKEDFVANIIEDIKWLGFDPGHITYTSDYFDILSKYAILLITNDLAYVDFTSTGKSVQQLLFATLRN